MQALSKPQKILAVMYELCRGDATALQYEDIVVAAFKRYPEDFQLRGYLRGWLFLAWLSKALSHAKE